MPVELPYLRKNIREFIQLIDPLIAEAENLHPAELIQMLRSILDYDRVVVDSDLPAPMTRKSKTSINWSWHPPVSKTLNPFWTTPTAFRIRQ